LVYSVSGGDSCGGGVDIGPFYCFSIQFCSLDCRVDTSDMSFVIFNESGCLALVMLALNPLSHVMRFDSKCQISQATGVSNQLTPALVPSPPLIVCFLWAGCRGCS
jgi:hypothetical protein